MKIKENFVLQEIADEYIVVPVGEAAELVHGVIKLNRSGAYLWKKMVKTNLSQDDLVQLMLKEFPASIDEVQADISLFIKQISDMGCII